MNKFNAGKSERYLDTVIGVGTWTYQYDPNVVIVEWLQQVTHPPLLKTCRIEHANI